MAMLAIPPRTKAPDEPPHTGRLLVAALATGVLAGIGGVLLTWLLHLIQHTSFGYVENSFLYGVAQAADSRRVLALASGGAIVASGWWLQRALVRSNVSVTHALATPSHGLRVLPVISDAVLQIAAVGVGASLGREGAPRQVGAAFGERAGEVLGLRADDRRILLAAGAGAGLAAVYNVPLSGVAFALEALLATLRPRAVVVAAISAVTATLTARILLGSGATYQLPAVHFHPSLVVAALVLGPVCALGAALFRSVMTDARRHAPSGWSAAVAIVLAFTALGTAAIWFPEILGNGKGLAQEGFTGSLSIGTAAVLVIAKPIATWLCLRSGAIGGLLTPAFATGATIGLVAAHAVGPADLAAESTALALIAAGAFLAVAQRMPVTAGVLALELTHAAPVLALPIAVAIVAALLTDAGRRRLLSPRSGPARSVH